MANFCTKCGRKLIPGQPCICTQPQAEETAGQNTEQEQTVNNQSAGYEQTSYEEVHYEGADEKTTQSEMKAQAMNFLSQALEMIKHPSTGFVKSVSNEDSKNGLILMGIEAILTGLYLFVLLQKIVSTTVSAARGFLGTSASSYAQTPSVGQFFVYGLILAAIVSLVIAALVMGLMKGMAGAEINWFQSCQIAGMRSLGVSLGWILGILGLLVGMYQFALIVVALGGLLGSIYLIVALMSYPNTKKDMIAYVTLIVNLVAFIVTFFILKEFVISAAMSSGGSAGSILSNIL